MSSIEHYSPEVLILGTMLGLIYFIASPFMFTWAIDVIFNYKIEMTFVRWLWISILIGLIT